MGEVSGLFRRVAGFAGRRRDLLRMAALSVAALPCSQLTPQVNSREQGPTNPAGVTRRQCRTNARCVDMGHSVINTRTIRGLVIRCGCLGVGLVSAQRDCCLTPAASSKPPQRPSHKKFRP